MLIALLFQTIHKNKIPIQSKDLGFSLVAREQMAYCSAYFFGALVLWESENRSIYLSWLCFRC